MTLAKQFAAYSEWRSQLSASLEDYRCWLAENEISDAQIDLRINQLQDKLREDRLNVAFVAEFSRGEIGTHQRHFLRRLQEPHAAFGGRTDHHVPDRTALRR